MIRHAHKMSATPQLREELIVMMLTFLAKMTDSEGLDKSHCHTVAALRRLLWQKRKISD